MAKPIACTPTLKGRDAIAFLESLYKKVTHVPSTEEIEAQNKELARMKASYEAMKSISNGAF